MARTRLNILQALGLFINRQDDTTNTSGGARIEAGWGVMTVNTSTRVYTEAVTFATPFTNKPIVIICPGGDATTATGAAYGNGTNSLSQNWGAKTDSILTTGFTADLRTSDNTNPGAAGFVFYQWIAIGA